MTAKVFLFSIILYSFFLSYKMLT